MSLVEQRPLFGSQCARIFDQKDQAGTRRTEASTQSARNVYSIYVPHSLTDDHCGRGPPRDVLYGVERVGIQLHPGRGSSHGDRLWAKRLRLVVDERERWETRHVRG